MHIIIYKIDTNRNLLHSTGNHTQIKLFGNNLYRGKKLKKNVSISASNYLCVYVYVNHFALYLKLTL